MLTGHSFSTVSQSSFPAKRRKTIASSSASKRASKYSPGDAGAKPAGTVRRRLESKITIIVGLSHSCREYQTGRLKGEAPTGLALSIMIRSGSELQPQRELDLTLARCR